MYNMFRNIHRRTLSRHRLAKPNILRIRLRSLKKKPPEGGLLHEDGRQGAYADATSIPLNSPVAMRFCHSAGPVIWALVPPASTATVTGISTTSNS